MVALFNIVLVALGALGCDVKARRTPDDTVVVVLEAEITELDPRYALTNGDTAFSRLVASGLTAVDTISMEPRMDLATSIEMVDPLTWVATLREDARFSDGTPLTADDVAYTFQSALDPAMKAVNRRMLGERFDGPGAIEVIDAHHVRFKLRQPLATFLSDLDFGIVSKAAALAASGGRWPGGRVVGAGPFQVDAITSTEVRLSRNPHYHGTPAPMAKVVGRTVRDANARLLMLAGGSADLGQNIVRLDLIDDLARSPRLAIDTGPSAILTYMMFNNDDPVLRDVRVRRALAMAVDRGAIVRAKLGGRAVLATGLLPPSHWAYAKVELPPHDLDAARALLDEAGYRDPDGPGGKPRLSLSYKCSADPFRLGLARVIAHDLEQLGVEVDVRSYEFATFFADVKKGAYQLAQMQTSQISEPDMTYLYFHSSRVPTPAEQDLHNRWRYRSKELDALVEAGRHELDRERRRAIYGDVQRVLARDLPILPLWHEDNVAVHNRELTGYTLVPTARLGGLAGVAKTAP